MNNIKSQQGAALLILVLSIIFSGAIFLLTQNNSTSKHVSAENKTSAALAKAKEALISYAVSHYLTSKNAPIFDNHLGYHGFLPCPESSISPAEGEAPNLNCGGVRYANHLGRLPWKTLEIPPLKDNAGECLWYAMSSAFSFNPPESQMLNDDTPGMFQVFNENRSIYKGATPEDRAVAVVIAPGGPLNNQARVSATTGSPCNVLLNEAVAADYLENYQGIDNALVSNTTADRIDKFIHSTALNDNPSFNDRIITITAKEIFDAIKARAPMYTDKITELGETIGNCLIDYATPASGCTDDCDADRQLCKDSATTGQEVAACSQQRNLCRTACGGSNLPGNSGNNPGSSPGGTSYAQLPWPAPVDLKADYRNDNSYADLTNNSQGYFGRLPYKLPNSSDDIGVSVDNIFTICNLKTSYPEMFRLWQHWKDHWFYVLGSDFAPDLSTSPASPCDTDCPEFNGTRYAAILIFSEERINNQLRRTNETEDPYPDIANSKATLGNYLEGNNESNYPDDNFNDAYGVDSINDRHFCITADMLTVTECP